MRQTRLWNSTISTVVLWVIIIAVVYAAWTWLG
jgi:hypothetical protein